MQILPLLVAAARNCGQVPTPKQVILSELSGLLGNWAGLVASVTESGTFWVCSPFTNGQLGEWRSCSDLRQDSTRGQHFRWHDEISY